MGSIYLVTNNANGKQYVGQTTLSLATRWRLHVSAAKKPTSYFHNAIRKYGALSFSYRELAQATTADDLNTLEKRYIEELKTRQTGYNLAAGGQNINHQKMRMSKLGVPLSEAHKTSLRDSWNHRDISPILVNLDKARVAATKANTGRPLTEEHRNKIAQAGVGRVFSSESRLKLSVAWTAERKLELAALTVSRNKARVGRRWVKLENVCKQVPAEQVGGYLEQGWQMGRVL